MNFIVYVYTYKFGHCFFSVKIVLDLKHVRPAFCAKSLGCCVKLNRIVFFVSRIKVFVHVCLCTNHSQSVCLLCSEMRREE